MGTAVAISEREITKLTGLCDTGGLGHGVFQLLVWCWQRFGGEWLGSCSRCFGNDGDYVGVRELKALLLGREKEVVDIQEMLQKVTYLMQS